MNSHFRCKCGAIQGSVNSRQSYGRAVCYCKGCQAYARFFGSQNEILSNNGGTEILAMLPATVHFTAGMDRLACMSLSEKGLLRWYASCCRTPIGNTPRDQKISYVGLLRTCLPDLDESFGTLKTALNTNSAKGDVKATPFAAFFGLLRIMKNVISARLSGRYKENPFFKSDSGVPIKTPQVLTHAERKALDSAA